MPLGYYRFPAISGDQIVLTCEDDLWTVNAAGGVARRLTAGSGEASHTQISPDGRWLAFTGREEGHVEVYVMPAEGGETRRLSFLGGVSLVAGWSRDGSSILFSSNTRQAFQRQTQLFEVDPTGTEPRVLPWGAARQVSFERGAGGRGVVLGRNTSDAARWKRYKGGTAGDLWVDVAGNGDFARLAVAVGNPTSPMWVDKRIFFLADHEGYGNLYSCHPDGKDLTRHTDHDRYYARQASTDGQRIVYHAGADIYLFDPRTATSAPVAIQWHSPAPQRGRKFTDAARFMDGYDLHPAGHSVALTTRGKTFALGNWAGPVVQLGEPQGVRHRLPSWLPDGKRILAVHDRDGEESLVIFRPDGDVPLMEFGPLDLGRVVELHAAPHGERAALANHRHEVIVVDLATKTPRVLDRSTNGPLMGLAFSPDGAWLAYAFPLTPKTTCIKLVELASGEIHQITEPVLHDVAPSWDPGGDFLYFITYRYFDPVYDNIHFDLGFPRGTRPALVTLRPDVLSPFVPRVELTPTPAVPPPAVKGPEGPQAAEEGMTEIPAPDRPAPPRPVCIDFAGMKRRVVPFPVPEGRYETVIGLEGKVMFTSNQPEGALGQEWIMPAPSAKATLEVFDFTTLKRETVIDRMTHVQASSDRKHMLVQIGDRLRVLAAGEKPKPDAPAEPGRESGWIDLGRVRVSVDPRAEWRQMYREAWRLQRDNFWTADMSSVDWAHVHETYLPLLERVATRGEFSDLLWEMQGELGTSHAYEWGGDYRPVPRYDQGLLGADCTWDETASGYRIDHIVAGDPGEPGKTSPLNRMGLNIQVGDVIVAIGGHTLSRTRTPGQALVHQAHVEVQLTLAGRDGGPRRSVGVRTLAGEWQARYRDWVENNRLRVHEATDGRIGYVHIPDMGPHGFAEFHRAFLVEGLRDGLVVDVRNNGGGHVSQLILEKLARRPIGYDVERWGPIKPYPENAVAGPLVALTNEIAGSDGDIFSHCFKLMKLGPLLGKRTWGGVIGIWPRHGLVDGTFTTQPEYSFWFADVGWGVENYGAEPDIEVDIAPQDYGAGKDPQLERAIAEVLGRLKTHPPLRPAFTPRPNLAPPVLPPRRNT